MKMGYEKMSLKRNSYEKAILIIEAVRNEINLGTKHYSISKNKILTNPKDIIIALSENDLIIEPAPNRQHLFRK